MPEGLSRERILCLPLPELREEGFYCGGAYSPGFLSGIFSGEGQNLLLRKFFYCFRTKFWRAKISRGGGGRLLQAPLSRKACSLLSETH